LNRIRQQAKRMRSVNTTTTCQIRPLRLPDVHQVLDIIKSTRRELCLAALGPALLESTDYSILDVYRRRRSAYFVATQDGAVIGGAGIAPLQGGDWKTCELQRMYLRNGHRGHGVGQALLDICLERARTLEFEHCYAETISAMSVAIAFYQRNHFRRREVRLGDSGHAHNDYWLLRAL
jgi:putative acetyltransferase